MTDVAQRNLKTDLWYYILQVVHLLLFSQTISIWGLFVCFLDYISNNCQMFYLFWVTNSKSLPWTKSCIKNNLFKVRYSAMISMKQRSFRPRRQILFISRGFTRNAIFCQSWSINGYYTWGIFCTLSTDLKWIRLCWEKMMGISSTNWNFKT